MFKNVYLSHKADQFSANNLPISSSDNQSLSRLCFPIMICNIISLADYEHWLLVRVLQDFLSQVVFIKKGFMTTSICNGISNITDYFWPSHSWLRIQARVVLARPYSHSQNEKYFPSLFLVSLFTPSSLCRQPAKPKKWLKNH